MYVRMKICYYSVIMLRTNVHVRRYVLQRTCTYVPTYMYVRTCVCVRGTRSLRTNKQLYINCGRELYLINVPLAPTTSVENRLHSVGRQSTEIYTLVHYIRSKRVAMPVKRTIHLSHIHATDNHDKLHCKALERNQSLR